jgi:dihydrofolate reductase
MGNVIYSMMASLDGFIARPNGDLDWVMIDEELHRFANERERNVGTHLYGRRMYETMAAHWPTADQNPDALDVEVEFALLWQQMPKVVFSTTLERVDWNARLAREVVADEVKALKAASSEDMSVSGASIAATFMQLDLINVYQFYLQPVILGEGIPLFSSPEATRNLRLVETHTFKSGVVFLHYRRADAGD